MGWEFLVLDCQWIWHWDFGFGFRDVLGIFTLIPAQGEDLGLAGISSPGLPMNLG